MNFSSTCEAVTGTCQAIYKTNTHPFTDYLVKNVFDIYLVNKKNMEDIYITKQNFTQ